MKYVNIRRFLIYLINMLFFRTTFAPFEEKTIDSINERFFKLPFFYIAFAGRMRCRQLEPLAVMKLKNAYRGRLK